MNDPQDNLPELIDCCRPTADDLVLPELRPLAEAVQADLQVDRRLKKSQRIDALIGQSIRDVPLPAGLEERLLAALVPGQPRAESNGMDDELNPSTATSEVVPVASRRVLLSRWKVWLPALGAVAAVVIAILFFHDSAPRFDSQEDVAIQSNEWLDSLIKSGWQDSSFPFKQFPLPTQPVLPPVYRWQPIAKTSSSLEVMCYNMVPEPATLFVCRGARSPKLPSMPPDPSISLKPGWQVGGWQTGEIVYVLVVQGDAQRYKSLIRRHQKVASIARPQVRS